VQWTETDKKQASLRGIMTAALDHHTAYMQMAIREAEKAGQIDEVPIGAVLVSGQGDILASTHNQTIRQTDPTAHAEILALRHAAVKIGNYRLLEATLYVTIEPCIMCMGALVHARIATLVYGAHDPKWGAAGSIYNLADDKRLNHQIDVIEGICKSECREIMQRFFRSKRASTDI
jgi:tRNA(adenine34) deaminase